MRYDHFTMLPERAFRLRGSKHLATLEGGGKGSPDTPDYEKAAQQTAQGNLEAARAAAAANRVNQYTPSGNLVYSHNPQGQVNYAAYNKALAEYNKSLSSYNSYNPTANATGIANWTSPAQNRGDAPIKPTLEQFTTYSPDDGWSVTQTLSPAEQAKFDKNNALQNGLLDTAGVGLGFVDKALATGGALNESILAQPGIQGQAVQDAIMSRLQPQIARNDNTLRTRLANQGLNEGTEAYQNAMTDQSQQNNDLYVQAALQGIQTGQQARQQGIQEQYAAQDRPLNIVNALRTGNQVNTPQFTNVPQQATTQGADLMGAATQTGQFTSANQASRNAGISNVLGSLFSAGGMYLGGL